MKLTVIGSEPAWPSADKACSGYLLETDRDRILIDCGTGVFARLRGMLAPEQLSAVVLSHLHFDHWADLIPFKYYLNLDPDADKTAHVPLHLLPGGLGKIEQVVAPIDDKPGFFSGTFDVHEFDPKSALRIEDISIRFLRTTHPIETYALRFESGASAFTFSADTGWQESVADFARGSSLFLCEAAFGAGESAGDMHLTAKQAGKLAANAGVRTLVLTHLSHKQARPSWEAASSEFSGEVFYAEPGKTFEI